jgi:hypothetical protein
MARDRVPYDNDPRPLAPANPRLKTVPEDCGPNPTQDGPVNSAGAKADDMTYLDTTGPEFDYLTGRERAASK